MPIDDAMLEALDKAGPEARKAFFAKRSPEERAELAAAIPKWREERPSELGSFVRASHGGALFGFRPALTGLASAVGGTLTGEPGSFGDRYRNKRDEVTAEDARYEAAHPDAYAAGRLAGTVGTSLIPGLSVGKGLSGAVATGALQGGAQALGESDADLTRGEFAEAAKDTALGATLGGVAGGIGHGIAAGVGKVAGKIAGRGSRGVAQAEADETAKQALLQAKKEASALGKYRSAVQSASRDLEVLGREGTALPQGATRQAAEAFLQSPEGLAVREMVAANKLGTAPERLSEMAQLRGEYDALVSGRQGLVQQATDEALSNPIGKQFAPRLATLGHRLIPAALAGAGGLIGGPEGAAVGAGLGGLVALTQGRPGIIIRNLIRSPAARRAMWQFVQDAATIAPQSLGRFGAAIAAALRQGNAPLAEALHERGLEQDEQYQNGVLGLLREQEGAQ